MTQNNDMQSAITEALRNLDKILDKIPVEKITSNMRDRVVTLRQLLLDQREPRFALVGRRGSGKSSLVNALLGEQRAEVGHATSSTGRGQWYTYSTDRGSIRILDTRGLQEGSKPDSPDDATTPRESILRELKTTCPDAVLFLVKAKEVDAAIDTDLSELEGILQTVQAEHGAAPPLVGIVTSCDELEPKNVRLHRPEEQDPRDLEEKIERVRVVEHHLEEKIKQRPLLKDRLLCTLGISSYQSWRADGSRRDDERWRIEELIGKLVDELPKEARVELVRVSKIKNLQRSLAKTITRLVAGLCATVAFTPIPVADIVPITTMQVGLVASISYVAGRSVTLKSAGEFLTAVGANVGIGFAVRELARAAAKLVPGAGDLVSSAIAYGTTMAIGKAASAYFIDDLSHADVQKVYAQTCDDEKKRYENDPETSSPNLPPKKD